MNRGGLPEKIFVTGTDTEVGKSLVSAVLMAGLEGRYWKPIQAGLEDITDTEWIRKVTELPVDHFLPELYRLRLPLSPHAAARAEGVRIELERFNLPETEGSLVVEGAGGVMVPLDERHFMLDLMKKLGIPVLLVARSGLGTINHTLLSLEKLRGAGLALVGVVMNGEKNPGNREAIEFYGRVKVIAEIEPLNTLNPEILRQLFERMVMGVGDWGIDSSLEFAG